MDGYFGGPGGHGSYFDADNPDPVTEPKMQQRNAEIAYVFAPHTSINIRNSKPQTDVIYGKFISPSQLTIQEEDLMFVARSKYEVTEMVKIYIRNNVEIINNYIESDRSPFAVFNGLRKSDNIYISYRFIGVAETGGPKMYDPLRRVDTLTIIPDGVVNYINITDTPIEVGVPMTWDITSVKIDSVLGHPRSFRTPNQVGNHDIYKGYFKPFKPFDDIDKFMTPIIKKIIDNTENSDIKVSNICALLSIYNNMDNRVVGINMDRVGPRQRGQILLRPR